MSHICDADTPRRPRQDAEDAEDAEHRRHRRGSGFVPHERVDGVE
jgi:hypothetical protein